MKFAKVFLSFAGLLILSSTAYAQFPVITAEDVKSWMDGKKKVVLIDTRTPDEYVAGHIPGAINIFPDRISAERKRLPKDPSTPIIFYCRGAG